jgi:anaerobic magnesium-protoporphyrin IX monomethyl ester cyclase
MKVLLIFPPLWIPHRPYLSLPSLCAYLKSNGVNVIQKDFNVEAYNLLLSDDYLKGLLERLQNQFDALDSKDRLTPGIEQRHYCNLHKSKSSVTHIAEKIEKAKGVFRSKQAFYDVNALSSARNILKLAQALISTACFPTGQDLTWPINAHPQRSLEDIKKLTQNRAENPFLELYERHLLPFILKEDPDIIGISITVESQLVPALTLSRLIKSSQEKAHVVVGGCIISQLSDILMKYEELFNLFFDSAVLNEGERPLLKLVENISRGQTLKDVPNLIYLDLGKIRANEVQPAEDINSLPTPCFDGLPLNLYLSPEPVLPILSSRGCYWSKCVFCSDTVCCRWHYQSRDANKVVDDMQELSRKHGVVHFAFSDEAVSPSSASKLSDELIKRGMNIRCSADVRFERQFTPELCHKMFKAGFRLLYFGLESGCNRILNLMEKGITKETAAEVCRNVYEAGIWNHLYVFFGFPTETRAEAQETIDFLLSNKNIIHSFNIDTFILLKGSPMMKCPERYGISGIDAGPDTDFSLAYNYTVSSGLTSSEALELSIVSRERIAREYKSKKFFKLNLQDDILLYLSHFERSDPSLSSVTRAKVTKTQPDKQLTKKSVPRIKLNVVLDKLRFDIIYIINNIVNNKNVTAYPRATYTIFDPVSEKLWPVSPLIVEILALCDGRKSVQQIAHELSNKYDAKRLTIEEDCIAFLKSLSKEGFVLF